MKRCDSAHSDTRSAEKLDAGAVRRSRAALGEVQTNMGLGCLLLKQPTLEWVALDRHNPAQCPDEEPVTLSQDVAEAE